MQIDRSLVALPQSEVRLDAAYSFFFTKLYLHTTTETIFASYIYSDNESKPVIAFTSSKKKERCLFS